jgi:hypothetical protein
MAPTLHRSSTLRFTAEAGTERVSTMNPAEGKLLRWTAWEEGQHLQGLVEHVDGVQGPRSTVIRYLFEGFPARRIDFVLRLYASLRRRNVIYSHFKETAMALVRNDDDEDFWGRPSVKQRLDVHRAQRRSRDAEGWRRNFLGMLIFCALVLGALAFWR